MIKAKVRATLLALMLPLLLNATHILRNDLLKLEAVKLIDDMGEELQTKTGIHAYVIASNERFPERYNLVEYSKQYEANISKPYVLFIFAPYAMITKKAEARGRVGIIPSSDAVKSMYDYEAVRDAGIDIVAMKDTYALFLTLTFLIILIYPVFRWIMRLGKEFGETNGG